MRRPGVLLVVAILVAAGVYAYRAHSRPAYVRPVWNGPMPTGVPNQVGEPRPDLTTEELSAFYAGKALFTSSLPAVGPLYNAQACAECHTNPTLGGSGDIAHAAHLAPAESGDVEPYRKYAMPGWTVPTPPPNVSRRVPPALFGLGLIERVPDDTIRAACGKGHPDPAKLLGSQPENHISRFSFKPFVGTIPDFVDAALLGECSITTPIDKATDGDEYPDPEVDREFVDTLAAFVRGLQPPPRNGTDAAGEAAFHQLGCATCHVPDMPPAFGVFSDLCVHHMGEALSDGTTDHTAQPDEFRTTPLWGLRWRKVYLHDGRADSLHDAIVAHAGEAQTAADAYQAAPEAQRAALFRFLDTL